MAIFKSTMNAPLTDDECARIKDMWLALRMIHLPEEPEPVQMLDIITDIIGACWEVRRAVDDGWYHANNRAFPGPAPRRAKPRIAPVLAEIEADLLKLTHEELVQVLKEAAR